MKSIVRVVLTVCILQGAGQASKGVARENGPDEASLDVFPQMFLRGRSESSVEDWTPYFQQAINAVAKRGGGTVRVPARATPYAFTGSLVIQHASTVISGEGANSILMLNAQPGDFITFSDCSFCGIEKVTISGNLSYEATRLAAREPYAITLGRNTNSAFVRDATIRLVWNGIHIFESNGEDQVTGHVDMASLIGHYGIRFDGTAQNRSYRATIENFIGGDVLPADTQPNASSTIDWAPRTAYARGDIVRSAGGTLWVAMASGRSGSSGPGGIPGAGAATFDTPVRDGDLTWRFVSGNLTWIDFGSFASSLVIRSAALLGGIHGVVIEDTIHDGHSAPHWLFGFDVEADHNLLASWEADAGEAAKCDMCWFGSLTGYGAWYGDQTTQGSILNSRIAYNGAGGLHVSGTDMVLSGNQIGENCGYAVPRGDRECAGLWVGRQATPLVIVGNILGNLGEHGDRSQPQGFGLFFQDRRLPPKTAMTANVVAYDRDATNIPPGNPTTGTSAGLPPRSGT